MLIGRHAAQERIDRALRTARALVVRGEPARRLRNVFRKLGARRRSELARVVASS